MLLKLYNIRNIKETKIEFDGITVIVGENNTGKTTISKSLFSFFASFRKLSSDKEKLLRKYFTNTLKKLNFDALIPEGRVALLDELINYRAKVKEYNISDNDVYNYISDILSKHMKNTKYNPENFEDTVKLVIKYINKDDSVINGVGVRNYFINEFNKIIYNVKDDNFNSKILLGLHYKGNGDKSDIDSYNIVNSVEIDGSNDNCCVINEKEAISNNVFYYDGINVDYNLDLHDYISYEDKIFELYNHKISFDRQIIFNDYGYKSQSDDAIKALFSCFGSIGKIYYDVDERQLLYKNDMYRIGINPHQLSQGLKGILVFRQFISCNCLEKRDILILDEPEVNLHPKWQVAFAELIIKLQKKYDLTVLLCSHSPFFIKAIKTFSRHYDVISKTKFYLAENDINGYNIIKDATDQTELVFKSLTEPYLDLVEYDQND